MKKKTEQGITLIALVITIIVLLILAGISIATLTGENGVLSKATTAQKTSQRMEIIENARIDILAIQAENKGQISKKELTNLLESKYGSLSSEEEILDKTLTSKDGKHQIKVEEIWKGTFATENEEKITCYHFYVQGNLVSWSNITPESMVGNRIEELDFYGKSDQGWYINYYGSAEGYYIFSPDGSIQKHLGIAGSPVPKNGAKISEE